MKNTLDYGRTERERRDELHVRQWTVAEVYGIVWSSEGVTGLDFIIEFRFKFEDLGFRV